MLEHIPSKECSLTLDAKRSINEDENGHDPHCHRTLGQNLQILCIEMIKPFGQTLVLRLLSLRSCSIVNEEPADIAFII